MSGRACLALIATLALCAPALPAHAAPAAQEAAATRNLYLLLIRQARTDGRPRAALAYLADFERKHPGDKEARILRVNCLLDLGQIDEAERAARGIPDAPGGDAATVRGHILAARGQWPAAIEHYRAALAADPANALTANALGYAQIRAGDTATAIETLRAATDLAPTNAVIRNNLLLALVLAGRDAEAEAQLIRLPGGGALRGQIAAEAARLTLAGFARTGTP